MLDEMLPLRYSVRVLRFSAYADSAMQECGDLYLWRDKTLQPKEVLQNFVELFNLADAEALADLYDDNAVNHQVANEPILGKQAIKEMFKKEFSQAKMVCIVENVFEDGDWAIMEWRDPLGLRGCGFFQIVNSKIVFQRGYWDKLSFLKQHNLPIE